MAKGETRLITGGFLTRFGRPDIALSTFVSDTFDLQTTMPTLANTGPQIATTPYSGPSDANGYILINTATTFTGIDFGNKKITIKTSAGVTFNHCKWKNTLNGGTDAMVNCNDNLAGNVNLNFCEIVNVAPWSPKIRPVLGHGYHCYRNKHLGFSDALSTYAAGNNFGGDIQVGIYGCYLGELSWWWNPTQGMVHPSTLDSHNDVIQHEGGYGLDLQGNYLDGSYSTTVGTGTPNSGSEISGFSGDSTYAQGVAARQSFKIDTYRGSTSSLACLMINNNGGMGAVADMQVLGNWFNGGGAAVNGLGASLSGSVGKFYRNRFYRNQIFAGQALRFRSGLTWDIGTGTTNRNVWLPDNAEVAVTIN